MDLLVCHAVSHARLRPSIPLDTSHKFLCTHLLTALKSFLILHTGNLGLRSLANQRGVLAMASSPASVQGGSEGRWLIVT
jgi:hypothetical protein